RPISGYHVYDLFYYIACGWFVYAVFLSWFFCFFFSSRRRHTRSKRDWSSDVCSSDLALPSAVWRVRPRVYLLLLSGLQGKTHLRSEERRVGKEGRSLWSRQG